ncbi:MAG: tyrosine-type recombinase/integrase [Candidatus Brocadiae bacterium]|nr:tyrosine-type recombinase/integrase [Candidatus Brocadiia bacterium]
MSLRAFFRYLTEAGMTATNPALVLKFRRDHRVPEVLSADERSRLGRLLAAAEGWRGKRDAALLAVLLGTGLRLASVVALDAADVCIEGRGLVARTLKGGGEVRKALSDNVGQRLAAWMTARAALPSLSPALFLSGRMRRLSSRQVQVIVRRWLTAAGVERRLTVHGLRHDFATRLYARTKDLLLVQRAMDHRSVASTLVYARVADERVAEAMAAM